MNNNPTALFRRVRDQYGNLVLSKNAQNYHPAKNR
nr:MAG TPA: Pumilio-family RNA binding repeat [Bacteriophage sp.]